MGYQQQSSIFAMSLKRGNMPQLSFPETTKKGFCTLEKRDREELFKNWQ